MSILGSIPVTYNTFIKDLEEVRCAFSSSQQTALHWLQLIYLREGLTSRVPKGKLVVRASRNLVKFKKDKCKVLHLEQTNFFIVMGQGLTPWEAALQALGGLEDGKLGMSQPWALAAKFQEGYCLCLILLKFPRVSWEWRGRQGKQTPAF